MCMFMYVCTMFIHVETSKICVWCILIMYIIYTGISTYSSDSPGCLLWPRLLYITNTLYGCDCHCNLFCQPIRLLLWHRYGIHWSPTPFRNPTDPSAVFHEFLHRSIYPGIADREAIVTGAKRLFQFQRRKFWSPNTYRLRNVTMSFSCSIEILFVAALTHGETRFNPACDEPHRRLAGDGWGHALPLL